MSRSAESPPVNPAAAVCTPSPNAGSEAKHADSEVPVTIDPDAGVTVILEDAGKKMQQMVGQRLAEYARKGNAEEMARLLKLKPDVNWRGNDGTTPLQAACQVGMDG